MVRLTWFVYACTLGLARVVLTKQLFCSRLKVLYVLAIHQLHPNSVNGMKHLQARSEMNNAICTFIIPMLVIMYMQISPAVVADIKFQRPKRQVEESRSSPERQSKRKSRYIDPKYEETLISFKSLSSKGCGVVVHYSR